MPTLPFGAMVQPQPGAPQVGAPPTTPEEQAGLEAKWNAWLSQPGVKAGLLQFGASMLANAPSGNFGQNLGIALGDAGAALGRNQEATMAQQAQQAQIADAAEGRRLQGEGVQVSREQLAETTRGNKAAEERGMAKDAADAEYRAKALGLDAAGLALREKELGANEAYRQMVLELDWAKLAAAPKDLTPREKALLEVVKNALSPEDAAQGKEIVDLMFPAEVPPSPNPAGTAGGGSVSEPPASPPVPQVRLPGDLDLPTSAEGLKPNQVYYRDDLGRVKLSADGKSLEQVQ